MKNKLTSILGFLIKLLDHLSYGIFLGLISTLPYIIYKHFNDKPLSDLIENIIIFSTVLTTMNLYERTYKLFLNKYYKNED